MATNQPISPGENPPPDLPSMPDVSATLTTYLRTFALWCRNGFASKLGNSNALPGVLLMATDAPSGSNPPVYMLEVAGGALALAPVALGSGAVGTPVPVGQNVDGTISITADAAAGDAAYVGFFDESAERRGYVGWVGGIALTNDVSSGQIFINDDGYTRFSGDVIFNNLAHAPAGISYGNWGYGGQSIRFDYDFANWGIAVIVNNANVLGSSSFLSVSFDDATFTAVRAWALNGGNGYVYAWYAPNSAWTWTQGTSDIRLKSNIKPAQKDALAAINALSVIECELTLPFPNARPQHWNWAVVANEDLEAQISSAYVAADEHTHATIRELPVIAALVKAVQQLTARVAELEARR